MERTLLETQIIELICHGFSNKAIAEKLNMKDSFIKTQVKNIYKKYDVYKQKNARIRLVIKYCRETKEN